MEKIISEIVEEMERQKISDTTLAKKAGYTQVKVSRLLNGTTKRMDMQVINTLRSALGIVEKQPAPIVAYPHVDYVHSDLIEIIENLKAVWPELCSEQKDAVRSVVNAFSKQPQFSLETNARQG